LLNRSCVWGVTVCPACFGGLPLFLGGGGVNCAPGGVIIAFIERENPRSLSAEELL